VLSLQLRIGSTCRFALRRKAVANGRFRGGADVKDVIQGNQSVLADRLATNHAAVHESVPGAYRTWLVAVQMSLNDPSRHLRLSYACNRVDTDQCWCPVRDSPLPLTRQALA